MSFRWFSGLFWVVLLSIACTTLHADYTLNMSPGVTPISHRIYNLHMTILTICAVIAIFVYGIMVWAIIYHRKARGAIASAYHESTVIEIIWTIVPFLILIAMAAPATYTLIFMEDTKDADLSIKITGYRWYWHYDYLNEDINFYSRLSTPEAEIKNLAPKTNTYLLSVDNPIVVPVGKKIRFLITANDVLHSWWVPALGIKKDAIPGFINESWAQIEYPGVYRGQCAELCGFQHGFMPIVVEAKNEEDYQQWLSEQKKIKVGHTHNMMNMES